MLLTSNLFVVAVGIGLIVGGVEAWFHWRDAGAGPALKRFVGWMLAFAVTGYVATPVAEWLLHNVLF